MVDSPTNVCGVCGKPVEDGADLCSGCASEVTMRTQMTVCPKCRTLLPANYEVCGNCNTPLRARKKSAQPTGDSRSQIAVPKPTDSVAAPSTSRPPGPMSGPSNPAPPIPRRSDSVPPVPKPSDAAPAVPRPSEPPFPSAGAPSSPPPPPATAASVSETTVLPAMAAFIREAEIGMLESCYETCVENRKSTQVLVTGQAGMGVSLLLKALVTKLSAALPPTNVFYVVAREFDEPFFPFSRMLREIFACDDQSNGNAIRVAISKRIGELLANEAAQIVAETAHLVGYVAGVPFSDSPILASLQKDQDLLHSRLKGALLRYFRGELKHNPVVLVLDDAHRMQMDTRAGRLFKEMIREFRNVPFFTVCGGRPELLDILDPTAAVTIRLEPLGDAVMRRLFHELLPKLADPPPHLVEGILQRSAGNPGSLFELCSLLKESGALNTEGEVWTAAGESKQRITEMLSDRRDALRARLDQIDPRDRLVLQTASVFGDVFWDEAITAMCRLTIRLKEDVFAAQIWADDSDSLSISTSIDRLVERKFLVRLDERDMPGSAKYAFSRSGIRDRILMTVSAELQNQYHCLAAEWLQHMSAKSTFSGAELEASHWEVAGQKRRAALACFRAAENARTRYLNQRAVDLYKRGLELTEPEDRLVRIDVLHDLGSLYELQGRLDEAEWCLTEMLRNAWILGYRNKAGAALNKIGRLYRVRGDGTAARAFLNRGMTLFKSVADERGVAACLGDLGELARQEGSFDRAYTLIRESFEIHRKLKNRRSMAVCLQSLGNIDAARATYDRAERFFNEALELRRKTNDRAGMAQTLSSLATLLFHRGDDEKAIHRFEAALELTLEVGDRRIEAQTHCSLGEVYRDRRDYKASMAHFKAAEEIAKAQKDRVVLCEVSRHLAVLAIKTGDMTLGRKYANRTLELAKKLGAKEMEALAFRALGELEAATMWDTSKTDGQDEAGEAFKKALQIFRSIGNALETAKTLHALGNRLIERGDIAQSRTVLKEAREIYQNIDPKVSEAIERTIRETSDHSPSAVLDHVAGKSGAAH